MMVPPCYLFFAVAVVPVIINLFYIILNKIFMYTVNSQLPKVCKGM